MKALVIGGTGPTGPHVVEGLVSRGYEVTILHRGTHEVPLPRKVKHIHAEAQFLEPELIAETLGRQSFDVVVSMYGRLRRIAEAIKGRTPRLLAIGGGPAYKGYNKGELMPDGLPTPIKEDWPLLSDDPFDHHGYMVARTEKVVMDIHRAGHYQVTIFRYPVIYGPRQGRPTEWCIIRRILDGRKRFILPDGGLTLEAKAYVENAAHVVLLALDKPEQSAGQIYNVSDARTLTFKQRVRLISRIMGHEWELVDIPRALAPPTFPYLIRGSYHRMMDMTKAEVELGYRDIVPPEEAIERTVRWLLENRPAPGGEEEDRLNDPFDYEAEDRFIDTFQECARRMAEIPWAPLHEGREPE